MPLFVLAKSVTLVTAYDCSPVIRITEALQAGWPEPFRHVRIAMDVAYTPKNHENWSDTMHVHRFLAASAFANDQTLWTVKQVCFHLTISEATLRRYCKNVPNFPRKIQLGPRRIGFVKTEVESFAKNGGLVI
ncbi:AlpA family phage regulatory protein [Agrobacterium pusense]|nr:AlpA family phage regulatory protein [Agrobacterium pusense]